MEDDRETSRRTERQRCGRRYGNSQETREEKRTGNVEISSGCEVCVCSRHARLFPSFPPSVLDGGRKRKKSALLRKRAFIL